MAAPLARQGVQHATPRVIKTAVSLSRRRYATSPYEPSGPSKALVDLPKRYVPDSDSSSSYQRREEAYNRQGLGRTGVSAIATLASVIGVWVGSIWVRPSENWDEEAIPLPRPTPAGFEGVLMGLKKLGLPEDDISQDVEDLYAHAATTWSNHPPEALPGAVLYPRSTEDVSNILRLCNLFGIPVVCYAGGTSLEGNFSALQGGEMPFAHQKSGRFPQVLNEKAGTPEQPKPTLTLCLDFARHMDSIIEIHPDDLDVVVQPGMTYDDLNLKLKKLNPPLFFPVDPGPGAAVGGMIATGCSGTNAVRYGTMRDNVLNLTVVLRDGRIMKTRQRARKCSAGPDVGSLFVSSEGTFGIITEATLKLAPLLPTSVGVASFPNVHAAAAVASELVRKGIRVQCVEILDDVMMKAVNKVNEGTKARIWPEKASLFIKFQGDEGQIKHDVAEAGKIVAANGGGKAVFARNAAEQEDIWQARKVALWSAQQYLDGARVWTTDVCVPLSRFPDMIEMIKRYVDEEGLLAPIVGHAGDGNIHALILYQTEAEHAKVRKAVTWMVERAQEMDGTCTGEHSVGVGKKDYLEAELGEVTVGTLRRLKRLFDPRFILNPGKLYPD